MRGYIPVDIPTKRYIKAYIHSILGEQPLMNNDHLIGAKLMDLLEHPTNEYRLQFPKNHYTAIVRVRISNHIYSHRGCHLNETNVRNFNRFVQHLIKDKIRFLLDVYVEQTGSFKISLDLVRERLKLDEEDWDSDSIKKDYWRYRKLHNRPLLYKKSLPQMSLSKTA